MRVLFVYLDFMIGAGGKYYEGLASLSAMLKQDKHQVDLLHITELLTVDDFTQRLLREYKDADVIGFSATTNVFPHVVEYSESIKKALPNTLVVCGGPHPTLAPEESIAAPGLDVICLGEGEYSLSELCNRLQIGVDFSDIEGLWVKQNGTVYRNPRRPFIQNLDDLPLPDRELFTFEGSADQAMDRLAFMGSRGCPYNCTHCCNHAFKKAATEGGGGGQYVRYKSPTRLIEEIHDALKLHPEIGSVNFMDDILLLREKWYSVFLNQYKQQIQKSFTCNLRFEQVNPKMLSSAKAAGCVRFSVGLESGNDYIRNEVLRRNQSRDMILKAGKLIQDSGINLSLYNMVGIPFETPARALDTVKMNAALSADFIQVSIFYPYEQTQLYDISKQHGFLSNKHLDNYFSDTILVLPDFPPDRIRLAHANFHAFVKYYRIAFSKRPIVRWVSERILDFLWVHPYFYQSAIGPLTRFYSLIHKWI